MPFTDRLVGWRLPYMLQWIWPVPLFIAALAGPESEITPPFSFLADL